MSWRRGVASAEKLTKSTETAAESRRLAADLFGGKALRFVIVKHFYCRYLGMYWMHISLLPGWGVACRKNDDDERLIPSLSLTTLSALP